MLYIFICDITPLLECKLPEGRDLVFHILSLHRILSAISCWEQVVEMLEAFQNFPLHLPTALWILAPFYLFHILGFHFVKT